MDTLSKNNDGSGGLFGILLVFMVIIAFGVFGGLALQSADDGYTVNNSTAIGRTAETNQNIMGTIWNMWPVAAILGFLLLVGALASTVFSSGGGGHHGRG